MFETSRGGSLLVEVRDAKTREAASNHRPRKDSGKQWKEGTMVQKGWERGSGATWDFPDVPNSGGVPSRGGD